MSPIERFFTKIVSTQRLKREETNDTEEWEGLPEKVACHLQTWMAGETGYEGAKFPTHQMWCELGVDIIKGDRVVDGEKIYEVLNIEELNYGRNPHMSILLSLIE